MRTQKKVPVGKVEGTRSDSTVATAVPVLEAEDGGADGSMRDPSLALGSDQRTSDTHTAIESPLTSAATGVGLSTDQCLSGVSQISNDDDNDGHNDDDKNNNDDTCNKNNADKTGNEGPAPSTSGNYLNEWTPEYSSSLSIFATLSTGNFLSENEITQLFSRYGNVVKVKWTQIGDNNGYIIVFSNETEKQNAIKVPSKITNSSFILAQEKNENNGPQMGGKKLFGSANPFEANRCKDNIYQRGRYRTQNTSTMTLNENMPSPERPGTRPSPATAFLLKQISDANMPESNQYYERMSRHNTTEKSRFLNLPAPYHLLPDTPYFRRAPIVPPPTRSLSATEQMSVQQRIINRYLASMRMDDENGFAAIAQYERQCYERLYASYFFPSAPPPEQQWGGCGGGGGALRRVGVGGGGGMGAEFGPGPGIGMNIGQHNFGRDFFGPTRFEDQTRIYSTFESNGINNNNNYNSNCMAMIPPSGQQYEVWNCSPAWAWNYMQ